MTNSKAVRLDPEGDYILVGTCDECGELDLELDQLIGPDGYLELCRRCQNLRVETCQACDCEIDAEQAVKSVFCAACESIADEMDRHDFERSHAPGKI